MAMESEPFDGGGFWRRAARKFCAFAYAMEAAEPDLLGLRIENLEAKVRSLSARLGDGPGTIGLPDWADEQISSRSEG